MSNTGKDSDNTVNKSNDDDKEMVEQQQPRETVNQVLSQIINDISTAASTDVLNTAAADSHNEEDDDDEDLTLLKDVKVSSQLSKVDVVDTHKMIGDDKERISIQDNTTDEPTFTVDDDTVKPKIQEPVQNKAVKRDTATDLEEDVDIGAFGLLSKQNKRKKRKKNKPTPLLSIFDTIKKEPLPTHVSKVSTIESSSHLEEDHLLFYLEDDNALHSARLKYGLQVELSNLKEEKEEDFQQIDAYASAKFQQRSDSLNRQINKVRVEMLAKQTRQRNQLEERHKRKAENDRRKMKERHEMLLSRQQEELERRKEQNKGPQWKSIEVQLNNRHDFQRKQFEESKIETINRTQQEHNASFRILENHHQKRQIEGETYIQNLVNTAKLLQDKMITKLSNLHQDRYAQREREIRAKFSELDSMDEDALCTNKGELHNMAVSSNPHDAVVRQETRKAEVEKEVVQIAVEIHNEGIIAISRSNENEPLTCFIPWGHKARSILYSVTVMGEIPRLENLKLSGSALVKCLITDSRVSEDTAACERADAFVRNQEVGIEELERRYNDTQRAISTIQGECSLLIEKEDKLKVAHHEAVLELQKSDEGINKIKARVLDDNGTLSSNIDSDNKQRMITAVKMNEELKKKEKSLRQPLELLVRKRVELHQMMSNAMALDTAIKNKRADHTSTDDKETIEKTIQRVHATVFDCSEKRRAQVIKNKKRSKWIKSAKELSMSDENLIGVHQIMQQKRITTILRPSVDTLLDDLKDISGNTRKYNSDCFDIVNNNDDSLSPDLRAEQLLYLALHPASRDNNTKPTAEKVEPGWQLMLDNPCNDYSSNPDSILPTDNEGAILHQLSSSAASTDRNVASFIKPHHMRILGEEAPQAASALGESNPFGVKKTTQDIIDPMSMTDKKMRLGYNFVIGPFIQEEEPESEMYTKERGSKSYLEDTGKEEPCLPVVALDQEPCLPVPT